MRRMPALRSDRRGVAAVEFAFAAPILFLVMFGIFDISYNLYVSSVLQGAVNRAARAATMENAKPEHVDQIVKDATGRLMAGPTLTFSRKAYVNFTDMNRIEDFTDVNGNGTCDAGEPYTDANGNGTWDKDRGKGGMGGARDAVLYEVTLSYQRMFPLGKMLGLSNRVVHRNRSVLRNQPWDLQAGEGATVLNCS